MLDQRNLLLDELAQFADIEVFQNNNGSVRVTMAGVTIIDDQDFLQLRMADYDDFNAAVVTFSNGEAFRPATGELKAYLNMLNGNGPYATGSHQSGFFGIPYYISALNVFAAQFAEIMNSAMNASLRAAGHSNPGIDHIDGGPRAGNENWEKNLLWAGYEYNADGSRRFEYVQARDASGRLMVAAGGEIAWAQNPHNGIWEERTLDVGEPVMIRSYLRAQITAANILVSNEWMEDEMLIGMTFDVLAGEMVRRRDEFGMPFDGPVMTDNMIHASGVQAQQQAMRVATNARGEMLFVQANGTHGVTPTNTPALIPAFERTFVHDYDSDGHRILLRDADGNPVRALNAQGQPIRLIDETTGDLMWLDADGNPTTTNTGTPAWASAYQGKWVYVDSEGDILLNQNSTVGRVPIWTERAYERDAQGYFLSQPDPITGNRTRHTWMIDGNGFLIPQPGQGVAIEIPSPYVLARDANGERLWHPNGNPVFADADGNPIADGTPVVHGMNGDPLPPYVRQDWSHYAPTGEWRLANLDGANLQRFIRELEAERSWGNNLDFHGCAFGKLQFLSNRLAQGIEYTSHEFDITMATVNVLLDNRDAVSGVCETEEGINMLKFQRWFNASARLMTSMDEALDIIINRMGRVGL
jgi:flagellar hook-associated protein FlgK